MTPDAGEASTAAIRVKGFRAVESGQSRSQTVFGSNPEDPSEEFPLGPVKVVLASDLHHIVYTDFAHHFYIEYDSTIKVTPEASLLWLKVQSVTSLPNDSEEARHCVQKSLATAVSCSLLGDQATAEAAIAQAKEIYLSGCDRRSRIEYTISAAVTGAVVLALSGLVHWFSISQQAAGSISLWPVVVISLAGGSIGALLSALGPRGGKTVPDPLAGTKAVRFDGAMRVVYGTLTAFVVTLAVRAQFVTSAVITSDKTELSLLLAAIAGGFLERWAVDIIGGVRPSGQQSPQ